jgi:hypothetical protein
LHEFAAGYDVKIDYLRNMELRIRDGFTWLSTGSMDLPPEKNMASLQVP